MAESESAAVPLGDTPILSNSLYGMAGVPGLEPGLRESKSRVLPLHHTAMMGGEKALPKIQEN